MWAEEEEVEEDVEEEEEEEKVEKTQPSENEWPGKWWVTVTDEPTLPLPTLLPLVLIILILILFLLLHDGSIKVTFGFESDQLSLFRLCPVDHCQI